MPWLQTMEDENVQCLVRDLDLTLQPRIAPRYKTWLPLATQQVINYLSSNFKNQTIIDDSVDLFFCLGGIFSASATSEESRTCHRIQFGDG